MTKSVSEAIQLKWSKRAGIFLLYLYLWNYVLTVNFTWNGMTFRYQTIEWLYQWLKERIYILDPTLLLWDVAFREVDVSMLVILKIFKTCTVQLVICVFHAVRFIRWSLQITSKLFKKSAIQTKFIIIIIIG